MALSRVIVNINLMLLGNQHAGKTHWLHWVCGKDQLPDRKTRLNLYSTDWHNVELFHKRINYRINFLNIDSQDIYQASARLAIMTHCKVDEFIVFYSVHDEASFAAVEDHVKRFRELTKNHEATGMLIGIQSKGQAIIGVDQADKKAAELKLKSYYAVNPALQTDKQLEEPLLYIIDHCKRPRINIAAFDLTRLNNALMQAINYSVNEGRNHLLAEFKAALKEFENISKNFTLEEYEKFQQKVHEIYNNAQLIYNGASSERIKKVLAAIVAAVLITLGFAAAITLLLPIVLPIAIGWGLAICAALLCAGVTAAGFSIYKAIEVGSYSDLVKQSQQLYNALPILSPHES